jgi:hypothetical protein
MPVNSVMTEDFSRQYSQKSNGKQRFSPVINRVVAKRANVSRAFPIDGS